MTISVVLGSTDIHDGTTYSITTNPAQWRNTDGSLSFDMNVYGVDDDAIATNRRAIISEINDAERTWEHGQESDRIALSVQLDTTDTIYFDVRGGSVTPLRWFQSGTFAQVTVRLICESRRGVPIARLTADVRSTSSTLTNGSATYLLDDVTGDYPARLRFELADVSTSGVINRFRLSLKSAASAVVGDWDPWVDVVNAGITNTTDATAFGGNYEAVQLSSADAWTYLGRATMPAGALNKGPAYLRLRLKDRSSVMSAPGSLSVSEKADAVPVVQTKSASASGSATSIEATWDATTTGDNTLVAVAKATKVMTKFGIASSADDASNAGETTITTNAAHGFSNGDIVLIEGVENHEPNINGTWAVSRVTSTTFNITIDTTDATAATYGTVRETFFEEISSAESGYVLLDSLSTPERFIEGGVDTGDRVYWRYTAGSTPDADTIEQTRYWLYVNPAATAESDAVTFTWDAAVTNRALALLEIGSPNADGGLGIVVNSQSEAILSPPQADANSILVGIAATKSATWLPGFGFSQQVDTGGLIVATKYLRDAAAQPWRATPSSYSSPAIAALLSITGEVETDAYGLKPGSYAVRAQALDYAGNPSVATASATPTLTKRSTAMTVGYSAPSATGISGYRLTVQDPDGDIWQQDIDNVTSYTITSLEGWEQVDALPSTSSSAYTPTPALIQVQVGTDDMTASTAATRQTNYQIVGTFRSTEAVSGVDLDDRMGEWVLSPEAGVFAHLPPQEEMLDGDRPDWAVEFFGKNGGGPTNAFSKDIDIDAMNLMSAESGMTLWYPGLDLATKRTWVVEIRRDGSVVAWLEDGSGNYVGQIATAGYLMPAAGDNVISIEADQADGISVISAAQFTFQPTVYPAADWLS